MKTLTTITLVVVSHLSFAQDIFLIKKSHNPKNVLHYKVEIENCSLKTVAPYWVMGEVSGLTEGLNSAEKPFYTPRVIYQKDTELDFSIGAMDKLGNRLPSKKIQVRLEDCRPKAYLEIKGQEIQLTEIYVKMKLLGYDYMTITGTTSNGSIFVYKIEN